jgi:hypothetical protein
MKSEGRMPKSERNPKPEIRRADGAERADWQLGAASDFGNSDFGLLSGFEFRISDF